MEEPAPGQFDFSQQKRTFRLELMRSIPQGLVATAVITFAVFIGINTYALPGWMKAAMIGSSSIGLLCSLFVVQLIRRIGTTVNRVAVLLWIVASGGFIIAAFAGSDAWQFFGGNCMAFIALGSGFPLMAQIYRKHYADEKRGRLFSLSSLLRSCVVALAGWGFGLWMQNAHHFSLYLIYSASCLAMAGCVISMAPVRLRYSNRIRWFDAFRHAGENHAFRKLLVAWMVLGMGNLIAASLFVEYIGNPRYGFGLGSDQSGLITSAIPMLAVIVTVVPWGMIFDRLPFYRVRALVNLFFIIAILVYYLGGGIVTLCVGIALHGIARSGGEILWSLWTTRFADSERVAEYQSVHSFLTGARGVLAPFIAFSVIGSLGPVTVAWISAFLVLVSTLYIMPEIIGEFRSSSRKS